MVRLLIPFSIESPLSLQPDPDQLSSSLQVEHSSIQEEVPPVPAVPDTPVVTMPPDVFIGDADIPQPDIVTIDTAAIAANIWATVACGFLVYTAVSYILLRRKVRDAVPVDEGIYECAAIDSPFLLGYIKPSIYLPAGLPLQDLDHILAHEKAHIRRLDNWTKLVMFVCLALHWFNPLVWAAYILLCRDIEVACDEAVIAEMPVEDRKAYSTALLRCAAGHRLVSACPVAFGEVSVKQRILKVLNYRKPAFLLSLVAVLIVATVAVCFLTDPVAPSPEDAYLAQCRKALEGWQDMDSRHLCVDQKYEGEDALNESSITDFWRSGDRYLRISLIPLSGSSYQTIHVFTGGKLLTQEYSWANEGWGFWASGWEESSTPISILYSWVDTFNWDAHYIQYVSCQTDEEMTVITLSVTEDSTRGGENHHHSENPYTVSFCFTSDGTLDHLVQSGWVGYETNIDGETEHGVQWVISTYQLVPEDADQIAAEVDLWYANVEENSE